MTLSQHHPSPTVDVNVPRFNQGVVAVVVAVAFIIGEPVLVAVTAIVLAVSWAGGPTLAPLTQLYVRAIRPRLQPDGPDEFEPAAPPRFSQLIGAVFLGGSFLALSVGWSIAGWGLALVVVALATLAATTRICVGCIIYERTIGR